MHGDQRARFGDGVELDCSATERYDGGVLIGLRAGGNFQWDEVRMCLRHAVYFNLSSLAGGGAFGAEDGARIGGSLAGAGQGP